MAKSEPITATSLVRDAKARGNPLDAISSPPVYCYRPHATEILRLFRLIFVMSPLRECSLPYQLPDDGPIIFAYAADSPVPVPQDMRDKLSGRALLLRVGGESFAVDTDVG